MAFVRVTEMLSNAFWSRGIGIEDVRQGARHSAYVVGAFGAGERQIGFARVIPDCTRFAYIPAVIVDPAHRRQGIGLAMMNQILGADALSDVYQWMPISSRAAPLYEHLGFERVAGADRAIMARYDAPPRRQASGGPAS